VDAVTRVMYSLGGLIGWAEIAQGAMEHDGRLRIGGREAEIDQQRFQHAEHGPYKA